MRIAEELRIKIDGQVYIVDEVHEDDYLPLVVTEDGQMFYLAASEQEAQEAAAAFYQDIIERPETFFAKMPLGGSYLSPFAYRAWKQYEKYWPEYVTKNPHLIWAMNDNKKRTVTRVGRLAEYLPDYPAVAYLLDSGQDEATERLTVDRLERAKQAFVAISN